MEFCGQQTGKIGADGRVKVTSEWRACFFHSSGGRAVLVMLPEGCVALFPRAAWERDWRGILDELRAGLPGALDARAFTRLSGAFRQDVTVDDQGRIRIPGAFRNHAGIEPSSEIVMIGAESRIEIWSQSRWAAEQQRLLSLAPDRLWQPAAPTSSDMGISSPAPRGRNSAPGEPR